MSANMGTVSAQQLPPEDVASLLRDLCIELGFCLPPEDHAALCASPPPDADAFTEAVFRAEGMDAEPHETLWQQVHERVARTFENSDTPNP
ncbi:hypothetical protein DMH08_29760 [Actinomadura sp. WAC 06369]|nr:hypothetical protein DMH08_29760 [Actinomadura sp. WAC 06369]